MNIDHSLSHEIIIDIDPSYIQNLWQDYPRTTSKYSPSKINMGRDVYQIQQRGISDEYFSRILRRFGGKDTHYIRVMANAHLSDIISKLAFIMTARNGKVVTCKDLQLLFDLEGIKIVQ
jgi:hypothetical protein